MKLPVDRGKDSGYIAGTGRASNDSGLVIDRLEKLKMRVNYRKCEREGDVQI